LVFRTTNISTTKLTQFLHSKNTLIANIYLKYRQKVITTRNTIPPHSTPHSKMYTNDASIERDWLAKVDSWLVVEDRQTQTAIGQKRCSAIGYFRSVFDTKLDSCRTTQDAPIKHNIPTNKPRFLRNAWIFLRQISAACLAGYCPQVQCLMLYLLNTRRNDGKSKLRQWILQLNKYRSCCNQIPTWLWYHFITLLWYNYLHQIF